MDRHGSHTTAEFVCICKQNDVELLYLPAHSSHVLQVLDLGVFAPPKSKYRSQKADLAKYDDAAQIKKETFINCYHPARSNTFNSRVLRSGWKAAVRLEVSSRTMCTTIQSIRRLGPVDTAKERSYISQLGEAGRVIDSLNARVANLESENARWKTQAASNSSNCRRGVPVDPNTTFASIESIVEAKGSQALREQRDAFRGSEIQAENISAEFSSRTFEEHLFTWQLDGY
ncbi:hypothetical protein K3495_g7808 [Podosphaera aphanis]|nr:hypothetical protein K3495_g7808 [Podosphaera aphanis]